MSLLSGPNQHFNSRPRVSWRWPFGAIFSRLSHRNWCPAVQAAGSTATAASAVEVLVAENSGQMMEGMTACSAEAYWNRWVCCSAYSRRTSPPEHDAWLPGSASPSIRQVLRRWLAGSQAFQPSSWQ